MTDINQAELYCRIYFCEVGYIVSILIDENILPSTLFTFYSLNTALL